MRSDPDVFVIGEDVLDPYGGAFKVTKGLSSRYPDRVLTTPISEAGIVGFAAGMALRGYKPVVEIMFGDFVTLIADQLINQVSKMTWMYNEKIDFPMVVRAPMGGRRGYGPTHSQTLERLFLGVPGLVVAAISPVFDPGEIVRRAILEVGQPVFLVENKLLYQEMVLEEEALEERFGFCRSDDVDLLPTVTLSHGDEADVTLIAYGGMVPLVLDAAERLHTEEELDCDVVVPHRLSPLAIEPLIESVRRSRRVVVVEEGVAAWGWGAEVVAALSGIALEAPAERVGAAMSPIPASRRQEQEVLPQIDDVVAAAIRTVDRTFA